ncbi:Peroxygenase 1 [Batrachochytrium dendrobatidis]|nr:Peroxygenase 1 [Batrachochytrium dendrobatidis]KAK5665618.1 Peroxygenase 1 [Batrachochytrium dendrobatidis]
METVSDTTKTAARTRFELRSATIEDVPLIRTLIRELAEFEKLLDTCSTTEELLAQHLFGVGSNPDQVTPQRAAHVLIASEIATHTPVGMALYFFNFSTFTAKPGLYLEDLYIREAYRGAGIGSMFFDRLASIAKDAGCGRMEWSVLDWNERARSFYKSLDAKEMEGWLICRLDEQALQAFPRNQ